MQSHEGVKRSELNQGKNFVADVVLCLKFTNSIPTVDVSARRPRARKQIVTDLQYKESK
jgi:hypothetical protein